VFPRQPPSVADAAGREDAAHLRVGDHVQAVPLAGQEVMERGAELHTMVVAEVVRAVPYRCPRMI
jgi:hypothetical protein